MTTTTRLEGITSPLTEPWITPRAYDVAVTNERPLSALPSPFARMIAFISILIGGLAGALIGYTLVDIQYEGSSSVPLGLGLLIGAFITAGGTAIISVLVLRAAGEWRDLSDSHPS